jgi:hypothetical protein
LSTVDEARTDIRELRKLGTHKYLLVTIAWHSVGTDFPPRGSGPRRATRFPRPIVIEPEAGGGRTGKAESSGASKL